MKRKKWAAFILSATMVFTCCATAFAQDEAENAPVQTDAVQDEAEIPELPETDMLKTAETAETPVDDVQDEAETAEAPDADVQDEAGAAEAPDADVQDEATSAKVETNVAELQPLYKTDAAAETMEAASVNTLTLASDDMYYESYEITVSLKDDLDSIAVGDVIDLSKDLEYQVNYCYLVDDSSEFCYETINMENEPDMRLCLGEIGDYSDWDYADGSDETDLLPKLKRTSSSWSYFSITLQKQNEEGIWESVAYDWAYVNPVDYDITYEASYGENTAGSSLFYDYEAVFNLSTTSYSYDLPKESYVKWVIDDYYEPKTVYTTINDPLCFTPSSQENYPYSFVSITASVCYADSDTGVENEIATYYNFYTVFTDGYSYTNIDLEDVEILVGETIDLATTAKVYTTTYSVEYPDGYITNAEIVGLQLYSQNIATYDENGDEDDWIYESIYYNSGTLEEKVVHIDGTTITGLAYGEAELDVICKDVNGNESIGSVYIFVDPNPNTQTPTDDNKTTPSAEGSAVNTNNADSTTAAANTGSTDPATATANTGSTDSAASPKTSDVNYMGYIILLLAAFGTLTTLSVKARKKTN